MVIRPSRRARRFLSLVTAITFTFSLVTQPVVVFAQGAAPSGLNLPAPGSMVPMSESFTPLYIKGITINPDDPLKFSFIVNSGDTGLEGEALKAESQKLMKYFLASLTVPEEELWVNLSPYDRANIIPERFGYTEMGRDLLAQDYILKQITASVMYPESKTGSTFWSRVQEKVKEKFGAEDVPVNMFNKIWIVPDKAEVYEINGSAYVVDSHLKVLLEEDYFALKNDVSSSPTAGRGKAEAVSAVSADVVREVLLPEIEKEVNEGKNFANLRQIYNASILATWYKLNLKDSLLGQVYVDKNKVSGVDAADKSDKLKIYEQYVEAFKKGAYELVKKDYDPATQQIITRKYFSGGVELTNRPIVESQQRKFDSPEEMFKDKEAFAGFQKAVRTNGDKDWTVNFSLAATDERIAPQISSSPEETMPSLELASLPEMVLAQGPAADEAIRQKIIDRFPTIGENKAQDIIDLLRSNQEVFRTPEGVKGALATLKSKNWTLAEVEKVDVGGIQSAIEEAMTSATSVPPEIAVAALSARDNSKRVQESIRGTYELNEVTAPASPVISGAITAALQKPEVMNLETLQRTVNESPEFKQLPEPVKQEAFRNLLTAIESVGAGTQVKPEIAVAALSARDNSKRVQESIRGTYELNEVTAPASPVISGAITAALQKPEVMNLETLQRTVNESPEFKQLPEPVKQEAFRNLLTAIESVGAGTQGKVDVNVASSVPQMRYNQKQSVESISAALGSNADGRVRTLAPVIASSVVGAVNAQPVINLPTLTRAVEKELTGRGITDKETIKLATQPDILYRAVIAAGSPVDQSISRLPVELGVNPRARDILIEEMSNRPDLNIPNRETAIKVVDAMKTIAPADYLEPNRFTEVLGKQGVSVDIAGPLYNNIRDLADIMPKTVDSMTASLPAIIPGNQQALERGFRKRSEIRDQSGKLAKDLSEMSMSSRVSFSSPERLATDLKARGYSDQVSKFVTSLEMLAFMNNVAGSAVMSQRPDDGLGGIDINPAFLKLLVKRDGKGIPIPTAKVPVKDTDIYGFEPVIANVQKVDDLPAFIGIEK